MENPLELLAPPENDRIERVHALARDIAYGAVQGSWTPRFRVRNVNDEGVIEDKGLNDGLKKKWDNYHNYYAIPLLASFGYLVRHDNIQNLNEAYYELTPKAFALLEKPATPPSIFISHKQNQSSAFGLLIEARLKLQDGNIGVFIDRDIPPGEKWSGFLDNQVKKSQYFVCLLTIETLTSKGVKNEINEAIRWTKKRSQRKIIPICHNGYNFFARFPNDRLKERVISEEMIQTLSEWQAIIVEQEKAEYYDFAILKLLNRLGYSVVK